MSTLPDIDARHLRAATGWLELGNDVEANEELEKISPAMRSHPDVLETRWKIYAKAEMWEAAAVVSEALTRVVPERAQSWLSHSYSLRRSKGVQAAWDFLLKASLRFLDEPLLPYTLACYACQLGNLAESREWLLKAFEQSGDKLKIQAMHDPDLEPLLQQLGKI